MELNTTIEGEKATLELNGKLTAQTSPDLSDAVNALPSAVRDIDIDLTEVTYIASAGLRVLVAAKKQMASHGGTMRLLHPCDDVMDIFEMTGLVDVLEIER